MNTKKLKNMVLDAIKQNLFPLIVLTFALLYWYFTRDIWTTIVINPPSVDEQNRSFFHVIFGSEEMIKMVRMTLFYAIPILIFTFFVYFLFIKFSNISLKFGGFKVEIAQKLESQKAEMTRRLEIQTATALRQMEEASKKAILQINHQVEKVKEFSHIFFTSEQTFSQYLTNFLLYVRELFLPKSDLSYAFYFIHHHEAVGIDLLGMTLTDTPKIREFIADLIESHKADFSLDLEQRYAEVMTEFQQDVIHSIIGVPVLDPTGEIFGVILVYTRGMEITFSKLDADLLELLAHLFSTNLSRLNPCGEMRRFTIDDLE